jgi:hypothetical protein
MTFRGALVYLGTPFATANGVRAMVPWSEVVYDTDNFFNPADPTKLTIPAGITKVKLASSHIWANNSSGLRQVVIKKNAGVNGSDGFFPGCGPGMNNANNQTTSDPHATTAVIPVNEGDFFQSEAGQWSGTTLGMALDGTGKSRGTWFAIEVMEEGETTPPVPDGFETVFTETPATTMGHWPGQTWVFITKRASLTAAPPNPTSEVEVTLHAGAGGFSSDGAVIGLTSGLGFQSGMSWPLKDGANTSFTIPANGSKVLKAAFVDDGASDIALAIQHAGSGGAELKVKVGTGNVYKGYYKAGKDASSVVKAGYAPLGNSDALNQHSLVSKIRIDGF